LFHKLHNFIPRAARHSFLIGAQEKSSYRKSMRLLLLLCCCAVGLTPFTFGADQDDYCPLAEGMEWTMDAKITTPDGKVIDTTAHRKIDTKEEREGKTYYRMRTWVDGVPELREFASLERKEDTGVHSIDLRNAKPNEVLSMVLPLAVGKKWTREDGKTPITYEVVALEDLTIGGKLYKNCYRLKASSKDGNYAEEFWQAPGLGSIKSDVVLSVGAKISVWLREFKPGNK
jgi:hypothetical protein